MYCILFYQNPVWYQVIVPGTVHKKLIGTSSRYKSYKNCKLVRVPGEYGKSCFSWLFPSCASVHFRSYYVKQLLSYTTVP